MGHPATILLRTHVGRSGPLFELRVASRRPGHWSLEVWETPSPATPRLRLPERTAGLEGRVLELVETRVLRRLKEAGIRPGSLKPGDEERLPLHEDHALNLALLFRTLAPMRSLERIREVAEGIDRMSREEAGYWLGMAVHRRNPRRVLAALRMLLRTT